MGQGGAADVEPTSRQQLFALYQSLIFNVDVKDKQVYSNYMKTIFTGKARDLKLIC